MPKFKTSCKKMADEINFNNAETIIEYGSGTGVFTSELIKRKNKNTTLILIEENKRFYEKLKNKYKKTTNTFIYNDSAENIIKILNSHKLKEIDYILSGLPFTSFPESLTDKILTETKKALGKKGFFITFQYSLLKKRTFEKYLDIIKKSHILLNFPPAYILTMKNK